MERIIYIPYAGKKYPLIISKRISPEYTDLDGVIFIECKAAGISQEYLKSDLLDIIEQIPDLIYEKESKETKDSIFNIRMTANEKKKIEALAKKNGYKNAASFVRDKLFDN